MLAGQWNEPKQNTPEDPDEKRRRRQLHTVVALGLFCVTFLSLALTVTGPGLAWDEVFYLGGADSYGRWFQRIGTDALRKDVLFEHWRLNKEHPPLAKVVIWAAISLWGDEQNFVYPARLGIGLVFSVLVAAVYLFMARHFDLRVGLFSALSLLLMPRLYGHAHLSELDVPMAATWFICAATFVEAVRGRWTWRVLAGVAFGLALLTKINAFALPPILCIWGLAYFRRKAIPACLLLGLGVPIFFLGWPWLWIDTMQHLAGYFDTLSPETRTPIPVYYLGSTYGEGAPTPFHYPFMMTVATLPLLLLLASLWASVSSLKRFRESKVEIFLVLNAGFILVSASMPGVPRYDGVRLFLPAFPFIACLAGLGLGKGWDWLRSRVHASWRAAVPFGACFVWLLAGTVWMSPFYLSYYGGLVGGAYGAHQVFGMESIYWAESVDAEVVDTIVRETPEGGVFAIFPHERFALDLIVPEIRSRRPDIREGDLNEDTWDVAALSCRQGMFTDNAWRLYREGTPILAHRRQGVPLCLVFRRGRGTE